MPEGDGGWGEWSKHVLITLERIEEELRQLKDRVGGIEQELAVFREWRRVQGEPTAKKTEKIEDKQVDLRIEVAKVAAQVGGVGAIAVVVVFVLKALGVL